MGLFRLLAFSCAAAVAASSGCSDRAAHPPVASASSQVGTFAPSANASAAASAARRADARWRLAEDGDEARAAELGNDTPISDLASALTDVDAVRAVALRALPYAGDRDGALGALGAALEQRRGDEAAVADAIERTLARHRRDTEMPSRDGAGACATALEGVSREGGRGGLDPSRAASLARRVAE